MQTFTNFFCHTFEFEFQGPCKNPEYGLELITSGSDGDIRKRAENSFLGPIFVNAIGFYYSDPHFKGLCYVNIQVCLLIGNNWIRVKVTSRLSNIPPPPRAICSAL